MHLLHRWNCPWTADALPDRRTVGAYGELVAASFLRAQGVKILRQDFRWGRRGEVDLVARQGETLVFCEVKSATSTAAGAPGRMVNRAKRELLRWGARNWLHLLGHPVPYRFDVVEVLLFPGEKPRLNWIRKAFTMEEGGSFPRG